MAMVTSTSNSWKLEYQHGTFVIWPPDAVRKPINELRKVHDPRSQSYCEAHISLTPPLKRELTEEHRTQLEAIFKDTPPFTITLGAITTFPSSKVIYVEVEPQAQIRDLRERLLATGLFARSSYPNFTAHCTVSEFGTQSEAETKSLLESLRSRDLSGSFQCCAAALIVPDENFTFSVRRNFELGSSAG